MKKLIKKNITFLICIFALFGCTNKTKLEKDNYLVFKEELLEQENFTSKEELPFDLNISVDKINEEEVSYRAIIDNPKENMNNITALLVHDYINEEIFPSIGIFDDKINLIVGNNEIKGINLVGYIKTEKELNLNLRLYVEYDNDLGEIKKIYYKTTN